MNKQKWFLGASVLALMGLVAGSLLYLQSHQKLGRPGVRIVPVTIHDPDGNMIELVHHPLGVKDSAGNKVELLHDPGSLTWTRLPGFGPSA